MQIIFISKITTFDKEFFSFNNLCIFASAYFCVKIFGSAYFCIVTSSRYRLLKGAQSLPLL